MANIYRAVINLTIDEDINCSKKVVKEFSSEHEAKTYLYRAYERRQESIVSTYYSSLTQTTNNNFKKNWIIYLELKVDNAIDTFYIEKVPAVYALLSFNLEVFDSPTDLIGLFDTLKAATKAGISLVKSEMEAGFVSVKDFEEYSRLLGLILVPINDFVNYYDNCGSWKFSIENGQPVIVKNN